MSSRDARTEGERWTREQLELLRGSRFSPPALIRFLRASDERAREVREARPELARQARRWEAAGAGAWLALAAADKEPYRRGLLPGLAWWGGVAAMLDWHLGMLETETGEPRPLGTADALTLGRAWLVPAIADGARPGLLAIAASSDLLDGVAARASRPTRAGRDLETIVDASALLAALRAARRADTLPGAAVRLELARLGAGVVYAFGAYFGRAAAPDPRLTGAGRLSTPLRVAGLIAGAAGRRRVGGGLLAAGSLAGLAALGSRLGPRGGADADQARLNTAYSDG